MNALERDVAVAAATLSRRHFLGGALATVAAGLASAGCSRTTPAWAEPPAGLTLEALSPRGWATLTVLAARLAGPAVAGAIARGELQPGPVADAWLARTDALRDPLLQALTLLELGVWPLLAKVRPFTALAPATQDAVLDDLRTSRFALKRAVYGGVRSVALLAVYLTPAAHTLIGYPPPFGGPTVSIADAMAPLPERG